MSDQCKITVTFELPASLDEAIEVLVKNSELSKDEVALRAFTEYLDRSGWSTVHSPASGVK